MVPGVGLIFTSQMSWKTVFNTVFKPLANFSLTPPTARKSACPHCRAREAGLERVGGRGCTDTSRLSRLFQACFPLCHPTERDWLWLVTCKAKLWLSGCVLYSFGCQSEDECSFPKIKQRVLIINLEQINASALSHMEQGQFTALPDLPCGFFMHRFISVSFLRKCLLFAFSENLTE